MESLVNMDEKAYSPFELWSFKFVLPKFIGPTYLFNTHGRNGKLVKFYHFWPKNDGSQEKIIFEIPPNSVTKMPFFSHGGISTKKIVMCVYIDKCNFKTHISPKFHFDWIQIWSDIYYLNSITQPTLIPRISGNVHDLLIASDMYVKIPTLVKLNRA